MNSEEIRQYLRVCILAGFPTITAYGETHGKPLKYVSDVLNGHRAIPDWMLKEFNIQKQIIYTLKS